jgi:antitoxin PrlF
MKADARMTSRGRVTLPKAVRDSLGLHPGDEVIFRLEDGRVSVARTSEALDLARAEREVDAA